MAWLNIGHMLHALRSVQGVTAAEYAILTAGIVGSIAVASSAYVTRLGSLLRQVTTALNAS